MRHFLMIAVAAVALAGCQQKQELSASGAWVRLPAVSGRPGAAYFTLHGGAAADTLVAVSAPFAARAEMHETMADHDMGNAAMPMMTMAPIDKVPVPAGGAVTFAPGGRHVMLFDVAPGTRAGDSAPITLSFASGRKIEATAKIVGAGDPPPAS